MNGAINFAKASREVFFLIRSDWHWFCWVEFACIAEENSYFLISMFLHMPYGLLRPLEPLK